VPEGSESGPEFKILPAVNRAEMGKYAGQPMTNGAQAEVYASYFIGHHLFLIGGGKTYSQLSEAAMAQPKNAALAAEVQTIFRGTTVRSMLLEAYGFWQLGQIALIGAIVSYIAASLMLVLSVFGYVHLRRTAPEAEILPRLATRVQLTPADIAAAPGASPADRLPSADIAGGSLLLSRRTPRDHGPVVR
jgi:hypothetical protein